MRSTYILLAKKRKHHLLFFYFFILFFSLFFSSTIHAQEDKSYLEKERKGILNRIDKTNKMLDRTRKKKSSQLSRLNTINRQIKQRQQLINVIIKELKLLKASTKENEQIINSLSQDLEILKKEYSNMLYIAFKTKNSYEKLSFLFASQSIHQLRERINYWTKYEASRKEQIKQINKVKISLEKQRVNLDNQKKEKISLLNTQKKEKNTHQELRKQQRSLVGKIRKKESQIKSDLAKEKGVLGEINKLITKHIKSASFSSTLSSEDKLVSAAFAKNKANLIWPVEDGFIVSGFGMQTYLPETNSKRQIQIEKLGIDIRTNPNEAVRSVFTGKIVDVSQIVGRGYLVLIQHGDYFTVYSKLKSVNVKFGQKVRAKQKIGVVNTIGSQPSEIEFQIWRHRDKLDPEKWLSR